jgi:choline dehydrogenase-like flavoprotein
MRVGPVGIVNGTFGNRPHCIYRGYCLQGCKVNAKASPYVTHLPDALAHGVEVRADCMALRVEIDDATGLAKGVVYVAEAKGAGASQRAPASEERTAAGSRPSGTEAQGAGAAHGDAGGAQRLQRARFVAVAGYSIETPRLLLASTSRRFPHGVANNEDQVGRYVMVQGAAQTAGRWPQELRMYKAPPPEISSEQFYETDPDRGFARGFSIQTVSPLPIGWAEHVLADGHWGRALREYMRDYTHWSTIGVLNELLPHPENRVTLADETDPYGQPIARMDYTLSDNDKANMAWSTNVITEILQAGGAQDVLTIQRFAHLIGGARMGSSPAESVVDANQRSWAVPNLFVADGSACPTQGAANPALTIMALSSRLAERMASGAAMDDDPEARAGRGRPAQRRRARLTATA